MCDANAAVQLLDGGKGKMDIDKETVQVVAVAGGVIISVAALVFDGDLGYAMGTGILTIASAMAGYIFGKGTCENEAEVQK